MVVIMREGHPIQLFSMRDAAHTDILVNSAYHRNDTHKFYERAGYRSTGVRFVKMLEPAV
jgi:hypothetical protein